MFLAPECMAYQIILKYSLLEFHHSRSIRCQMPDCLKKFANEHLSDSIEREARHTCPACIPKSIEPPGRLRWERKDDDHEKLSSREWLNKEIPATTWNQKIN